MTAQIITIKVSLSMDPEVISLVRSIQFLNRLIMVNKPLPGFINKPINELALTSVGDLPQGLESAFCLFINTPGDMNLSHAASLTIILVNNNCTCIIHDH